VLKRLYIWLHYLSCITCKNARRSDAVISLNITGVYVVCRNDCVHTVY